MYGNLNYNISNKNKSLFEDSRKFNMDTNKYINKMKQWELANKSVLIKLSTRKIYSFVY